MCGETCTSDQRISRFIPLNNCVFLNKTNADTTLKKRIINHCYGVVLGTVVSEHNYAKCAQRIGVVHVRL